MTADDGTAQPSILRLRFPDGDVELRWTSNELPVGVLVRSRGACARVSSSRRARRHPAACVDRRSSRASPVVKPAPARRGGLGPARNNSRNLRPFVLSVADVLRVRQAVRALEHEVSGARLKGTLPRFPCCGARDCRRVAPGRGDRGRLDQSLAQERPREWAVLFYCPECALQFKRKNRTAPHADDVSYSRGAGWPRRRAITRPTAPAPRVIPVKRGL